MLAIEPLEDLYSLKQAARKLGFPSADALRMYLARHPGLVEDRYRRAGRKTERLLSDSEVRRILADIVSRAKSPAQ
mgnify:CR=1 FL=1